MNHEDAKKQNEAEIIWKTGKQEADRRPVLFWFLAFLFSKFIAVSAFASSRRRC
jgi:hypothetical protein